MVKTPENIKNNSSRSSNSYMYNYKIWSVTLTLRPNQPLGHFRRGPGTEEIISMIAWRRYEGFWISPSLDLGEEMADKFQTIINGSTGDSR